MRNPGQSDVLDRLWAKVDVRKPDECWPFTGYLLKGYGRIGLGGRQQGIAYAHRVVAEQHHGPAPSLNHQARHLCGNRACCNPAHLAWGTQSDNEMDKVDHGLSNRGERHGMHKITTRDVRRIRQMHSDGHSQQFIGDVFGIAQQSVSEIITGKTWSWLREGVMPS